MKKTIKGFITYEHSRYAPENPRIAFNASMPENYPDIFTDTVTFCEHTIEVDIPDDFDPRAGLIAALKARQVKAAADFAALCTDIQRQISQYEALTMEVKV